MRAEMIGFTMTNSPFACALKRQFRFVVVSLVVSFGFTLKLAGAQVTELPPIKKPEGQAKSVGSVQDRPSTNIPVKNMGEAPPKLPTGSHGETNGLSASDRALVAKACRPKQYLGPVAFHDCEREQAEAARTSTPASFIGVPYSDRALIAKACRAKQYYGLAAFRSCEHVQVESLKTSPVPSFESVSSDDRSMIAKACRSKQYDGPAAYRACQRDQVSQLKSPQTTNMVKRR